MFSKTKYYSPSCTALALVDPSTATEETMNVADGAVNFLQWYKNNEQARQMWSAYLDTLPTTEAHFDVRMPIFYLFFALLYAGSVLQFTILMSNTS